MVGAEIEAALDAIVRSGRRDHGRPDYMLGDLDADGAEIAACPHDQHGLAGLEPRHVAQQVPGRRRVAHDHGRLVEAETLRHRDSGASRQRDLLGEAAGPPYPHHAEGSMVIRLVLCADVERHHAGDGDAVAGSPARDAGAERLDHAGAIDAGNERQRDAGLHRLSRPQPDIEHAIDGGGMNANPDLAGARRRLGHVLVAHHLGRPEAADHDRFHDANRPWRPRRARCVPIWRHPS